jgi:hypothetical protein
MMMNYCRMLKKYGMLQNNYKFRPQHFTQTISSRANADNKQTKSWTKRKKKAQ